MTSTTFTITRLPEAPLLEHIERQIIFGLVFSDEFVRLIKPLWRAELVMPELAKIADICFAYHERYQRAPGHDFETIFLRDHAAQMQKAQAQYIEDCLRDISGAYEPEKFNAAFVVDQTVAFFRHCEIAEYSDQIQGLIQRGKIEEAREVARSFAETVPGDGLIKYGDVNELLNMELEPPQMFVHGILPKGVILLAGPPKLGKSILALHLCLAVAGRLAQKKGVIIPRQLRFLGRTIEHGHALYYDLEGNRYRLRERVLKFIGDRSVDLGGLRYAFEAPTLSGGFLSALEDALRDDPKLRLVVIDTWGKITGKKSGNRDLYSDAIVDAGGVHRLAHKYEVTVVLVHHTSKNASAKGIDRILGSIGLAGAVDTPVVFSAVQDEQKRNLARLEIISRDCGESDLLLERDPESLIWTDLGRYSETRPRKETQNDKIIAVLREAGCLSANDIAAKLDMRPTTVGPILSRMARDGLVTTASRGVWQIVGPTLN